MLLDYAAKCGGVVVSRDNYRDLIGVSNESRNCNMGQELHHRQERYQYGRKCTSRRNCITGAGTAPPAGTVFIRMELHRQELF